MREGTGSDNENSSRYHQLHVLRPALARSDSTVFNFFCTETSTHVYTGADTRTGADIETDSDTAAVSVTVTDINGNNE